MINKSIFTTFLLIIIIFPLVSASNEFVIYLDDKGDATFYGTISNATSIPTKDLTFKNGNIRGKTSELTNKSGDVWTFSFSYPNSDIQLVLPEGSVVTDTTGEVSANGKNIEIYSFESITISYTLHDVSKNNIYWIILLISLILSLLITIYLKYKPNKIKPVKSNSLDIIKKVLNDRENLIINKLKENGKIKSSHLRKLSNLPKASFSRHIQELEKKKIIRRSGDGRNKFIDLKK